MSIKQIKNSANIKKTTVTIDSEFRTTGVRNNFTYNLVNPITDVRLVEITNINLNYDAYNINSLQNTFNWTDASGITHNATIPQTNYTLSLLRDTIEDDFNATRTNQGVLYNILINTNDKLTFNAGGVTTFNLNFGITENSIAQLLGFTSVNKTGLTSYTSDFPVNLQYTSYIYIGSTNLGLNAFDTEEQSNGTTHIIAKMGINADFGDIIYVDDKIPIRNKIPLLSTIDITLKDDDARNAAIENGRFKITFDIYSRIFNNSYSI